ncbi:MULTISPECIES: ABC transporter permease subunit [Jeongeupia]|uniref:Ribose ABC transporter permease n=2 Tax=Jeongeupia TaxID=885864 RepID=A0ABS2BMH4_9NEIS|nr:MULTISPECIES: ribose ABC transporter permease [Jeongeupia]MBM3116819.1 ribose ABC transporter permease [Jeongeupia naejangsanensis]GHD66121.1 ribose ABC transporter permease [Jeongeupia chitinilytica]
MSPQTKATLQKLGPLIALVIMSVVLAAMSPDFLTVGNLLNVLRQVSINALIAFGMTFVILLAGIDLSVGSVLALSAALMAGLMGGGMNPVAATMVGLIAGAAMGLLNGLIVTKGKVAPFIATLGTMTLYRGWTMVYTNGSPMTGFNSDFIYMLGSGYVFGIVPIPVVITLVVFGALWFVLKKTVFGRHVYAVGGNPEASKLSGVKVDRVQLWVYSLSGLMAALAGAILTSRLNSAQPTAGAGYELDAIAAVVIGGTSLAGGRGWIVGTLIGAVLLGVLNNGLNLLGVSSFYQQVIKGIIILLAVLIDRAGKK